MVIIELKPKLYYKYELKVKYDKYRFLLILAVFNLELFNLFLHIGARFYPANLTVVFLSKIPSFLALFRIQFILSIETIWSSKPIWLGALVPFRPWLLPFNLLFYQTKLFTTFSFQKRQWSLISWQVYISWIFLYLKLDIN